MFRCARKLKTCRSQILYDSESFRFINFLHIITGCIVLNLRNDSSNWKFKRCFDYIIKCWNSEFTEQCGSLALIILKRVVLEYSHIVLRYSRWRKKVTFYVTMSNFAIASYVNRASGSGIRIKSIDHEVSSPKFDNKINY